MSRMAIRLQPQWRTTYPSEGANQDIQYLSIRMSGCHLRMSLAVLAQLNGFTVSSTRVLSTGTASSSGVTYCVFPGNRSFGYWQVKLNARTSLSPPSSSRM